MLFKDALEYFDGNKSALSRAAGHANPFTLYTRWGAVVPRKAAEKIQETTNGALVVNPDYYIGCLIKPELRSLGKFDDVP